MKERLCLVHCNPPTKRRIQLGWRTEGRKCSYSTVGENWKFHGIAVPNHCSWQAMTLQSNINVQWKKALEIERRTCILSSPTSWDSEDGKSGTYFIYKRCSSVGSGKRGYISYFPPDWYQHEATCVAASCRFMSGLFVLMTLKSCVTRILTRR